MSSIEEKTAIKYSVEYDIVEPGEEFISRLKEKGYEHKEKIINGINELKKLNKNYKFIYPTSMKILDKDDEFVNESEVRSDGYIKTCSLKILNIRGEEPSRENMYDIAEILGIKLDYDRKLVEKKKMECVKYDEEINKTLKDIIGDDIRIKLIDEYVNMLEEREKDFKKYIFEDKEGKIKYALEMIKYNDDDNYEIKVWKFNEDFNTDSVKEFLKQFAIWHKEVGYEKPVEMRCFQHRKIPDDEKDEWRIETYEYMDGIDFTMYKEDEKEKIYKAISYGKNFFLIRDGIDMDVWSYYDDFNRYSALEYIKRWDINRKKEKEDNNKSIKKI